MGKFSLPYSKKQILPEERDKDYFFVLDLNESDRFLFFGIRHKPFETEDRFVGWYHFGYYDKEKRQTFVARMDHTQQSALINDIDDFAPIYVQPGWSINNDGELLAYMEAGDIVDWFNENPEKAKKLPEHLKNLSKLKPEDNPVVVIIKLKQ